MKFLPVTNIALKSIFFALFICLANISHSQGTYKVRLCPGSSKAFAELVSYLETYNHDDLTLLDAWLGKWAENNKMFVAEVLLERTRDKKTFRWNNRNRSSRGQSTTIEPAIISTRSVIDPESIKCLFKDTLIVLDTLKFPVGGLSALNFYIKIGKTESLLPYNPSNKKITLHRDFFPGLRPGRYSSFEIWVKSKEEFQKIEQGTLYLPHDDEIKMIREIAENRLNEVKNPEEMASIVIPFMSAIWGGKTCRDKDVFNKSQAESLELLLNRR